MLIFFILSAIALACIGFFCGAWVMMKVVSMPAEEAARLEAKGYFAGYCEGVATKLPSEEVA